MFQINVEEGLGIALTRS